MPDPAQPPGRGPQATAPRLGTKQTPTAAGPRSLREAEEQLPCGGRGFLSWLLPVVVLARNPLCGCSRSLVLTSSSYSGNSCGFSPRQRSNRLNNA